MTFVSLGAAAFASPVDAASKTALSKKSVTITAGSRKVVKLKNVSKKVVWKSSNSKIARVVKTKGKYRNTAAIKGLKKGKAIISAKVGNKTYKCRVTVKEKDDIEIRPLSASSVNKSKALKRKEVGNSTASAQFKSAVTEFSVELFKRVSKADADKGKKCSVLVSPDSVATALAMLENGAAGNTLKEMKTVLGGNMSPADYCSYLAGMNDRLESKKKIIFQQSNSIWARKGKINVQKGFLKKNKNYFDAEFYVAPFNGRTVKDMNNWVYNNTRNMIPSVIDRLNADDRMVLINTTVFEGKWEVPFGHTSKGSFTDASGAKKKTTMLQETENYFYFTMDGAKCFARRYKGGSISFVGILPPEDVAIDDFIQGMSGSAFRSAWRSRTSERVHLTMPEFKYDYDTELNSVLQSMGMREAFTENADFSRMGSPSVMVDRVLHKTHIELDKSGTKAAAVTAVMAKASSCVMDPPIEITMDRPFVYAIVDTKTGIPLFIGSVKTL